MSITTEQVNMENLRDDFRSIDLANVNLRSADLTFTDLGAANLTDADLGNASLTGASLFCTNMSGANLVKANLALVKGNSGTNFKKANLTGANLSGSRFEFTNFTSAILKDASLTNVYFGHCDLRGADLRNADLTDADLIGANLVFVRLKGAIGLGTRESEIEFAQKILNVVNSGEQVPFIERKCWCRFICSLANLEQPSRAKISRLYPTISYYMGLYDQRDVVVRAIKQIANDELSVFPD